MRDLAEFQHVTLDSLVRLGDEEKSKPLGEIPELLAAIFPEKRKLHFKSYLRAEDPDAGHSAVDVRDIYQCGMDEFSPAEVRSPPPASANHLNLHPGEVRQFIPAQPPSPSENTKEKEAPPPESPGFDSKKILEESEVVFRARKAARTPAPGVTSSHFSIRNSLFLLRWGLALLFVGLGFWLWSLASEGTNIFLSLLLGIIPMIGAILLTVNDILTLAMDGLEWVLVRDPPEPIDYSEAEARTADGDWAAATAAYFKIIENDPHQLRAYREGIAAAVAANDKKKLAVFHASALKNLCAHDRNLLEGALRRHDLPPLPREPESSGMPKA